MSSSSKLPVRKWHFTRPQQSSITLTLYALVIAIAAHALLATAGYRAPNADQEKNGSKLNTLDMGNLSPEQQRQILNWLAIHDPTKAVLSNSPSSFNAMLPKCEWKKLQTAALQTEKTPEQPELTAHKMIPVPPRNTDKLQLFPVVKEDAVIQASTDAVILGSDNRVLDLTIHQPANLSSKNPTVLYIRGIGAVRAVTIGMSCGEKDLDQLAQQTLIRNPNISEKTVTVIWQQRKSEGKK